MSRLRFSNQKCPSSALDKAVKASSGKFARAESGDRIVMEFLLLGFFPQQGQSQES
jgi:hypothetical protein